MVDLLSWQIINGVVTGSPKLSMNMRHHITASRAIVFHDFQFDPALELSFENANACILKQEKDKRMCNCKYAIQDEKKRKIYYDEIHQKWTDNSYQRSLMQADYDMIHECA